MSRSLNSESIREFMTNQEQEITWRMGQEKLEQDIRVPNFLRIWRWSLGLCLGLRRLLVWGLPQALFIELKFGFEKLHMRYESPRNFEPFWMSDKKFGISVLSKSSSWPSFNSAFWISFNCALWKLVSIVHRDQFSIVHSEWVSIVQPKEFQRQIL